ncbi:hypothetical protein ACI8B_50464 [Acinetobacter proteolyticus]|uniref:Uncharacterized protein n=1 Tax=Acinetobacter proteolyticus TaxID=1776741 RepID=A0A653KAF6_9GAMM|nr:hypothetical protein ACI8B_50464 [Acinetobacter proteolyticus]
MQYKTSSYKFPSSSYRPSVIIAGNFIKPFGSLLFESIERSILLR